jgi:broad-specificity NMP kinase
MKKLYIIGGTMGVGKTTVSKELKTRLSKSVLLDGDWCWDMNPFVVNDETKAMVMDNICYLLNNFIHCSEYENIIFCWVLHEQEIIDSILSKLDIENIKVISISLLCSEKALRERIQKDIDNKLRSNDVLERSIGRLPLYEKLDTLKIEVSEKTITETVNEIMQLK